MWLPFAGDLVNGITELAALVLKQELTGKKKTGTEKLESVVKEIHVESTIDSNVPMSKSSFFDWSIEDIKTAVEYILWFLRKFGILKDK